MASARPFQLACRALIFALTAASSHALQLGENAAQITARHGAPAVEDHGRHLAVYFWEGWSAQLEFAGGVVGKLTYRSNTYLADADIQSLLQANGGVARWRETTGSGTKARQWRRDDGAAAVSDAARATGMIFQTGLATAAAIGTDSFLQFDAPVNPSASQPSAAVARNEPLVHSNAPMPQLRTEPQLRTDDVAGEVFAPEPAPVAEVKEEKIGEDAAPIVSPEAVVKSVAVATPKASGAIKVRPFFGIFSGLVLIAAVGFVFFQKRRQNRVQQGRHSVPPAHVNPRPPPRRARPGRHGVPSLPRRLPRRTRPLLTPSARTKSNSSSANFSDAKATPSSFPPPSAATVRATSRCGAMARASRCTAANGKPRA